jgi:intraflagellar transport protein 74
LLYIQFKNENELFITHIAAKQQDIERLETKISVMRNEVIGDSLKEKAILIYERLNESKIKFNDLESQVQGISNETAPQEKARLLEQVKQDNLETSGMERKITELNDEMKNINETLSQIQGNDPNAGII